MTKLLKISFILLSFPITLLVYPSIPHVFADETAITCFTTDVGLPKGEAIYPNGCQNGGADEVIQLAKLHLSKTYKWGQPPRNWSAYNPSTGNAPLHFDCSGFAGWVWYWATGGKVKMHGQTNADWFDTSGKYQKFSASQKSELQPGDLVYFGRGSNTTHVGIYEGVGGCGSSDCFIEQYSSGKPGRESSLGNRNNFVGFLRPVIN